MPSAAINLSIWPQTGEISRGGGLVALLRVTQGFDFFLVPATICLPALFLLPLAVLPFPSTSSEESSIANQKKRVSHYPIQQEDGVPSFHKSASYLLKALLLGVSYRTLVQLTEIIWIETHCENGKCNDCIECIYKRWED